MRKFSVRWWVTPELLQWKTMSAARDYCGPFFQFPQIDMRSFVPGDAVFFAGPVSWLLK